MPSWSIRKGPFWRRATLEIRKKSPQRTNRLEGARIGPVFERYRMIDSLAKQSLRFPRVFWSRAKKSGDSAPNVRKSEQCQIGSRGPAVSKAFWEKGGNEYNVRVCELASQLAPRNHFQLNCYRYVRSFCIIGARVPAVHAKWESVLANWGGYNCRADADASRHKLRPRKGEIDPAGCANFKLQLIEW